MQMWFQAGNDASSTSTNKEQRAEQQSTSGEHISFDAHVNRDEGGALLVPFPDQLLMMSRAIAQLQTYNMRKAVP